MASEFTISEATPSDIDSLVDIYMSTFGTPSHYFNNHMFPSAIITVPRLRTWVTQRFLKALALPEMHIFKCTEASTGQIVAWARWNFPHVLSEEEERRRKEEDERDTKIANESGLQEGDYPKGANQEVANGYFEAMGTAREKWTKKEDHYVLHFLATDPAYQRRGLGKLLLKDTLRRVDADGKRAYLEGTAEGHGLYLSLGWKDVDLITIDLTKWGGEKPYYNWVMLRDPQGGER